MPNSGDAGTLHAEPPGTVKGVITSRVDRLAPTPQVALKVASVLGRSFDLPTLQAVLPATIDAASLPRSSTNCRPPNCSWRSRTIVRVSHSGTR